MDEQAELKMLLEENIVIAKDNNRLLRLIRRDAKIGLIVKIVIWVILLGLPLLFLGPIIEALSAGLSGNSAAVFGVPTPEQVELFKESYGLE
jgi:hypothetical protein